MSLYLYNEKESEIYIIKFNLKLWKRTRETQYNLYLRLNVCFSSFSDRRELLLFTAS